MCAATAAMWLPVTATSMVPSMLFAGSITRPPRRTMSYCCAERDRETHDDDQAHDCSHEMHNKPKRRAVRRTAELCVIHRSTASAGGNCFRPAEPLRPGSRLVPPVRAAAPNPDVYTRIGVRPFINCTATLTINGGSLTFPEVIAAMEQAAHFHVDLDELMEGVSARLAELLHVDWAIVTAGTAAALTHATAACLVGTDPEKIQRLPNLEGLKDEVIMPRESRNVYDHAIRTLGVKIIEVEQSRRTAESYRAAHGDDRGARQSFREGRSRSERRRADREGAWHSHSGGRCGGLSDCAESLSCAGRRSGGIQRRENYSRAAGRRDCWSAAKIWCEPRGRTALLITDSGGR